MVPRAASHKLAVRFVARAAALVSLMILGASWTSADPVMPLRGDAIRQVDLLKPPHEDLRIRWSAMVHEEGGLFLISREGLGGSTSEVARVRPRGDGRYEVSEHGAAGSWIYRLRYRDRSGHEHVLITIRLNVERLDSGRALLTAGGDSQPVAVRTAAALPVPAAVNWSFPVSTEAAAGGPDYFPPTPPP
jgi:hypothetical protein